MSRSRIAMLIGVLFCSVAVSANNPVVTAIYYQVENGYRLDFVVQAGTYEIPSWGFERIDGFDLAAPDGWTAQVFTRYTHWYTNMQQLRIQPNESLAGCAITFSELPVQLGYFVDQMGAGEVYYGTLVPAPVPEPTSLLALGLAASGLGGVALRRRRR